MKSNTYCFKLALLLLILTLKISQRVSAQDHSMDSHTLNAIILRYDSLFWQAYNACDVDKMQGFFTDDLEFYHDKGGLTTSKQSLIESMKTGLCGKENWRLRREAVAGTLKIFPLNNYGAILSGEHVFYILETGKKERLDGLAKFTHVWRYRDNAWKMHRVLSYDHGPAPTNSP